MRIFILMAGIFVSCVQGQDVAIRGYDPVAYFVQNKAVKGLETITAIHEGRKWFFMSEENKKMFLVSPESYTPQFGGYCAYAAGNNYIYEADPEAWTIVDGRLYMNYSMKIREKWTANRDSLIKAGHKNWPELVKKK